jgi:hypothetical protein
VQEHQDTLKPAADNLDEMKRQMRATGQVELADEPQRAR